MAEKSASDIVVSVIGSISVLSVLIVVPYMIGYFAFFDRALLPVFSIAEYYYFSAVPILTISALFVVYIGYPFLMEKITVLPRGLAAILRYFPSGAGGGIVSKIFTQIFSGRFVNLLMTLGLPILIAYFAIIVPIRLGLVLLPVFGAAFLVSLSRIVSLSPYIFYFLMFTAFEAVLVGWGYNQAVRQYAEKKLVIIKSEKLETRGNLIFMGASQVALFDDAQDVVLVNIDKGATLRLGRIEPTQLDKCLDFELARKLRRYIKDAACEPPPTSP